MLLLLVVGSTALGVADRVRGVDAALALMLAVLGLFAGWWIGLTPLPARWASLVVGMLGLSVVLLRVGRLGGELLALLRAWNGLLRDVLWWRLGDMAPAWGPVWQALIGLGEGAGTLLARVIAWAAVLGAGAPAFDPAAVSFVWGLGLWAASAWAGWLVCRRERPLWAVTPSGALLLTALFHVWGSHIFLLSLLLAAFLLLALISYERRMRRWRATNVDYPELRPQTVVVTGFLSLALVTLAHTLPTLSIERVVDLVSVARSERSEQAEAVAESLGMDPGERTVLREARVTGLPRRYLLGAGPELSKQVVMVIRTEDRAPVPPEAGGGEPTRYYWRSHTYDRYTGYGWAAGETEAVRYDGGVPAITRTLASQGALLAQRVVRQEVRWLGEGNGLAHVAGTLMVADHDYTVAWRSPEDPFAATIQSTSYRADSFVQVVSEKGLREDDGSYPAWVRERYLALPEDVPERVLALARDLTATAATPFDRARAIETYLRGLPYTLNVTTPPSDRDVVDYFLFDLRKGYCDYYASAMVVLARAAGLPARLAVGYGTGTYDASEARYVVTEEDAHTWPEVYFPAYGWVTFEPTAGRPPLDRAAEAEAGWVEPEGALEPVDRGLDGLSWSWWQVVLGGVTLLGLSGTIWQAVDRWRLGRREPSAAVATLYRRLRRFGRWLGAPMEVGDTPREFGLAFADWVESASWGRLTRLMVVGADEAMLLTDLYGCASYSPRTPGVADRAQALQVWGRLRWRLWLMQVAQRLGLADAGAGPGQDG
jgi:transglutaminase-like putative cysteine protease